MTKCKPVVLINASRPIHNDTTVEDSDSSLEIIPSHVSSKVGKGILKYMTPLKRSSQEQVETVHKSKKVRIAVPEEEEESSE